VAAYFKFEDEHGKKEVKQKQATTDGKETGESTALKTPHDKSEHSDQGPESRVQSPESKVQSSKTKVCGPKSVVQSEI
jgi:hypothetical protein